MFSGCDSRSMRNSSNKLITGTPSLSYMLLSHYMIHSPISRLHHIIPRFSKSFITICQSKAPAKAKGPDLHPWCQAGWAALPLHQAGNVTQQG